MTVEVEGDIFNEQLESNTVSQEGQGSGLLRIHNEFRSRMAKKHPDLPLGSWFYSPGRLAQNKRVTEIRTRALVIPIGWPGADDIGIDNQEEVGRLMGQNSLEFIEAWKPHLLQGGISESDFNIWAREHRADVDAMRFRNYMKFHVCTASVKR